MTFNDDVTFLVGRNGSGKTTLINTISACLIPDYYRLARLQFKLIRIVFLGSDKRLRPSIVLRKDNSASGEKIIFSFFDSAKSPPRQYVIDDTITEYLDDNPFFDDDGSVARVVSVIQDELRRFVDLSWLSVTRFPTGNRASSPSPWSPQSDNALDQKVEEIELRLSRYLARISNQENAQIKKFQETMMLSIIREQNPTILMNRVLALDLEEEKKTLEQVFVDLGITTRDVQRRIDRHISEFESVREKFSDRQLDGSISVPDFLVLARAARLHLVVDQWKALRFNISRIYRFRDRFLNLLNKMMNRKLIFFDSDNRVRARSSSGRVFSISDLSSGEKQLFVLFAESMLYEERSCLYIADEPELSLHVEWQEMLIPSIRKLNRNAQIVVATHSPDIVGRMRENAISLEGVISDD